MTFYSELQDVAKEILTEFNQGEIILVRNTQANSGPSFNPGALIVPPDEYFLKGAVRGVSKKYIDGTNILTTDMQATVAVNQEIEPMLTDKIKIDGVANKILAIMPVPAAGTPVVNVIIFRK